MSAEVKQLRAVAREPVADVVQRLESLLARAKAGEIRQIAYAFAVSPVDTRVGCSDASDLPEFLRHAMGAAISLLQHRWMREWDEDSEDEEVQAPPEET
jgi:ParB-like chromosome segregation protein Spo0J